MIPAADMRTAVLRLAAAVQPPVARTLLAELPRGEGTRIEPCAPAQPVPRALLRPRWDRASDDERAWCAELRATMTLPPRQEKGCRR